MQGRQIDRDSQQSCSHRQGKSPRKTGFLRSGFCPRSHGRGIAVEPAGHRFYACQQATEADDRDGQHHVDDFRNQAQWLNIGSPRPNKIGIKQVTDGCGKRKRIKQYKKTGQYRQFDDAQRKDSDDSKRSQDNDRHLPRWKGLKRKSRCLQRTNQYPDQASHSMLRGLRIHSRNLSRDVDPSRCFRTDSVEVNAWR